MTFSVIIPTYNPGEIWPACIDALSSQFVKPEEVLVIDSGSQDGSVAASVDAGFRVELIERSLFNHGGTRNMAVDMCSGNEFVIFLTQDAILADGEALRNILIPFDDKHVAAVCGRQLPGLSAGVVGAHARLFNYPDTSFVRDYADREFYGIKTAFLSNSFAAYRVSTLLELGSFPEDVIFGEDMYVASKILKAGYKVAYAADACVYHSHDYSLVEEFRRYFDMGVFHAREPWIRQEFGETEDEGIRFVISELRYLFKQTFWRVPEGLLRTIFRYAGFRLGLAENRLPVILKRKLCMNKAYFK